MRTRDLWEKMRDAMTYAKLYKRAIKQKSKPAIERTKDFSKDLYGFLSWANSGHAVSDINDISRRVM